MGISILTRATISRGNWRRKEEMADGVVTVCQNACGLVHISLAGILEILGGDFSRGLEVLCEQVGLEQKLWVTGVDALHL